MPTLDWLHRDAAFRIAAQTPTRVLRPHAAGHVFGDPAAAAGNLLIQGDNLEALKALLPFYRGQVKCIFIDPPYNTKSAFEHYDDNLEHSQWLTMMLPRLQLLREFLREDGSIWVTIDDNEGHYLKVLMDEVFGRGNFIANVVWQKAYTSNQTAKHISDTHDHVLLFARSADKLKLGKLARTEQQIATFKNPDNDPRGPWKAENLSAGKYYSAGTFPIEGPTGKAFLPPPNRYWRCNRAQYDAWLADGRITFGLKGDGRPMLKKYLAEATQGLTANTWWEHASFGSNKEASINLKALLEGTENIFQTPKPEKLAQRVLELSTDPGDRVLDSFLGSGTTVAVAHKMGRHWIGVESGEHAITHCLPRMQKVIAGEKGGISSSAGWQGGGGFQMLQLGSPLFDANGDIHGDVHFADLAAFIWMRETGTALPLEGETSRHTRIPLLGVHEGTAYYLLFNGILGDRRPESGNVLNTAVLQALRDLCWHAGPKVVYGEACRLGDARLQAEDVLFRQLPHAVPKW